MSEPDRRESVLTAPIECEPELEGFHWLLALPLTLWCLIWVVPNGSYYFKLTGYLLRAMKWTSVVLLLSPCFWLWLIVFSASVWAPLNLVVFAWGKFGREFSRAKALLLVVVLPMVLWLMLMYVGPYIYPLTHDRQGHILLRFIPFLGKRSYYISESDIVW